MMWKAFPQSTRTMATALLVASSLVSGQIPSEIKPSTPAPPAAAGSLTTPNGPHVLTAEDLGAFLDGFIPLELHRENIAGAVVVVVKDGKVLYQQGYGYADVEKKIPVSPDATLFRPGSISKLFTWTAVMQLQEQGKINLDQDVNTYLDFKVPNTYPKPITMRNLMTHTAGFEEVVKDLFIPETAKRLPLRQYLITHMPERVYPPGTTPAYSNYGATLAAYIVQRVSGVPFDDYVEKNIYQPLAMTHSTFRQPLSAALKPLMSDGYALGSDKPKPFEICTPEPAGSMSTTGVDISHFMIAHLQGGEYDGAQILKPATVALMHAAQFAVDPSLPHMALGFYEETHNGHRIIGHAGDTNYFHSDLHLIQDQNLGFFVSYNSAGRGEISARTALFQAFLDRYFPYQPPSAAKQPNAEKDAQLMAGEYITSRRPVTNILSFIAFLENSTVSAGPDGTIIVSDQKSLNQVPKTWEEIGPLLYRDKNGQDLIGFTRDSNNRLVLSTDFPFEVATRASFADNKIWNSFVLAFVSIMFIGTLIVWPLAAWLRRHYKHPLALDKKQSHLRITVRAIAAVDLLFLLCWLGLFIAFGGDPLFDSRLDPVLRLFQLVGWIGSIGTFVVLYAVIKTWKSQGEWWLSHAGNLAVAFAAVLFSWFLLHWHLLHFSLRY